MPGIDFQRLRHAIAMEQVLELLQFQCADLVDDALRWFLSEGTPINAGAVETAVKSKQRLPSPTDVNIDPPNLAVFDSLLQHKDVYDEEETAIVDQSQTREAGGELEVYDQYVNALGAIEGAKELRDY